MLKNYKWKYGDSWEKYPIKPGHIWGETTTNSKFTVHDIMTDPPPFIWPATLVYCDPPWNLGNVNSFVTKNNSNNYIENFQQFYDSLFAWIEWVHPDICYLEIGKQHLKDFQFEMKKIFSSVQTWEITYYKKNPCYLVRGGILPTDFNYSGKDDNETPYLAIQNENHNCIADFCTGRGLTAISAFKLGKQFLGTELNAHRLAVTIDKIAQLGGKFEVL